MKSSLIELMGIWVVVSCISGLIVFSVLKIFDRFYSAQSASDKYQKGVLGLVFFFLLNLAATYYFHNTFIKEEQTFITEEKGITIKNQAELNSISKLPQNEIKNESQKSESLNFELIFKYVGFFWLIGALLFSLKMVGGYFYTRNLIISSQRRIPQNWHDFIINQLDKLQIEKSIKVFESEKVSSALTFGFLKPVIVVPLGFFTTLPTDQIEAVLLHEIYHIKHKDYLINLLIMAFEVIFFYHPVMWWLAKSIREERENRCDDQVTQITDKQVYAHALLSMETYRQSMSYAIPFSNKKSNLKMRIMRIFEQKPERNIGLKPFLSLLAIVVFLMGFTFYKLEEPKEKPVKAKQSDGRQVLLEKQIPQEPEEKVIFKSENSRLGLVIEMTENTLIAKSETENVKLFLDDKRYPLNKTLPFGENQIATMYEHDEEASYHFFTRNYFDSHNREGWEKANEHRNTYVFDRSTEFFTFKSAKKLTSETDSHSNEEINDKTSNTAQDSNSISKLASRYPEASTTEIYGPLTITSRDKNGKLIDTTNLELLKKLVKNRGLAENAEVQIKIDGKVLDEDADIGKALGIREIRKIRIVSPSKAAEVGLIEIFTDAVVTTTEPRENIVDSEIKKDAEKETSEDEILISFVYETDKSDFKGEMKISAGKEKVLDALGIKDQDILYVIDGEKKRGKGNLREINPHDIESITVLKGKKATNKYGDEGSNGVVEIYLKKE